MRVCSVLCLSLMMNDGVQYCIPVLHEDIWILCIKRFIAYLICTHSTVYQSCIMMKSGMQYCIPVGPAWWWMMVCSIVYLSVPHDDENWYAVLFPVPHEDEWWYAVVYTCPAWWWMVVCSSVYLSRMVMNDGIQSVLFPVPQCSMPVSFDKWRYTIY